MHEIDVGVAAQEQVCIAGIHGYFWSDCIHA